MKKFLSHFLLIGLLCLGAGFNPRAEAKIEAPAENSEQTYRVWRVIDGDTLKLSNDKRVVLEGIDTPEVFLSQKLFDLSRRTKEKMESIKVKGRMATQFTKSLVQGQNVRLEFDQRLKDSHDQLLAYVFLEDGTFVNAEIIKQGYAVVRPVPNGKYQDLFLQLEKEAKENKRGLWKTGSKT